MAKQPLKQGAIVRARVFDTLGLNPKTRPLVIVTSTEEIATQLVAVAVTGSFKERLADDEVLLPYHPAGIALTGLRKPSVAKCSWLLTLQQADIIDVKGFVPSEVLIEILARVATQFP